MTHDTVLVVEDDRDIVRVVTSYLEHSGYDVQAAHNGLEGLALALAHNFDVLILDWNLPGLSGLELMRRARLARDVPILMLSARGDEADRVRCLERGADDYLTKPFSPRELVARLRALQRRIQRLDTVAVSERPLRYGSIVINESSRRVSVAGTPLSLTALEFDLLLTLARQPERVFRREELLERVWEAGYTGVDRVVDVHISNLRQKLGLAASCIVTLRGVGYKFSTSR